MKQRSRFDQIVVNILTLIVVFMLLAPIVAFWWRYVMKPMLGW